MAGLFALAYGLIKGSTELVYDIRQKHFEDKAYSNAYLNGSQMYSHDGQLYWTATKQPCHIYIEPNGNKQIRSGSIYGQGMVLFDYGKEIYREYNEQQKAEFELAEKEYFTKDNRYYTSLDYNYDFQEKKRYVTRCSEENDLYWIVYLVEHNGIWCYDDINYPSKQISYEEWIKCGGNGTTSILNIPLLSHVLKKEDKEKRETQLRKEREYQLKIQKEQEEKLNQEILKSSWEIIAVLVIFFIIFLCI